MVYSFRDGWDRDKEPAVRLLALQIIIIFCVIWWSVKKYHGYKIWKMCLRPSYKKMREFTDARWHVIKW